MTCEQPGAETIERFGVGPAYSLGVAEELLLVSPDGDALRHGRRALFRRGRWPVGGVSPERCDSMVELVTSITRCAGEAADVLQVLRSELRAMGQVLLGAGLHPSAPFGDARPTG